MCICEPPAALQVRASRGEGPAVTAPPPETGIMIVQSKNVVVTRNSIFNTGLGIFVRGGGSSGNRIEGNTVTGGSNALLGVCYNPAPGDPMGPRGDLFRANLISGFGVGIQMSPSSMANVTQENTIVFRMAARRFPEYDQPGYE
jgi:parallel beta-helix repeat protein